MGHVRRKPLPPRRYLLHRLAWSGALAAVIIGGALAIGVIGYHEFGHLGWIDAIYNASMILGGMGPVSDLPSAAAKLFASAYALFSGVVFIGGVSVLLSPLVQRFLHRFHLETIEDEGVDPPK